MSLWLGAPLVLASKSVSRRQLLEAGGIPLEIDPADLRRRGESGVRARRRDPTERDQLTERRQDQRRERGTAERLQPSSRDEY